MRTVLAYFEGEGMSRVTAVVVNFIGVIAAGFKKIFRRGGGSS